MEISVLTRSKQNFCSRNKDIRLADDIQRRARLIFPMASNSKVDTFYKTLNTENNHNERAEELRNKIYAQISDMRNEAKKKQGASDIPYSAVIDSIKKHKCGNCAESSRLALYALCANGFYDSKIAFLYLETNITDKQTGEVIISYNDRLDHEIVITSSNKYSDDASDLTVVDAWAGFADSLSGAKERHKKFYTDKEIKEIIDKNKKLFMIDCLEKTGNYSPEKYEIKFRYKYITPKGYNREENKKNGRICGKTLSRTCYNRKKLSFYIFTPIF